MRIAWRVTVPHSRAGWATWMHTAVLLAFLVAPRALVAQNPEPVASVVPDSVDLAETFELRIEVPVPEGSLVFFPDTVRATTDVESSAPVEWRARRGPDGGATLELSYPLMAFGMGPVDLPRVEVITMPIREGVSGERIPGGSLVGDWIDSRPSVRYTRGVAGQSVWVHPLYGTEEIMEGLAPRPPDDVSGFSFSLSSIALLLVFTTVIGGAVVTTTREWLAGRAEPGPTEPTGPVSFAQLKASTLAEFERLIAAGPHGPERAPEVYAESSGIVRGFAERIDPEWGPELTSTELVAQMGARSLAGQELVDQMGRAEAVKFGRLRPDAPETEAHLQVLRAWVEGSREVRP